VYRQRGLRAGLARYLDLYTVAAKRPRIAVDDGSKLLYARPQLGRFVPLFTLVAQGPSVRQATLVHEGLVRPLCLAAADGSLLVGDDGPPPGWSPTTPKSLWRLPAPGRYEFAGIPAKPRRIAPPGFNLVFPTALAVDNATPWQLYVLD